jgi:hypothetical protein
MHAQKTLLRHEKQLIKYELSSSDLCDASGIGRCRVVCWHEQFDMVGPSRDV